MSWKIHQDFKPKYVEKNSNSRRLFEQAREIIPGGIHSNEKYVDPFPIYITRASGSKIYDVDENEYIDYWIGNGTLILGHNHPAVIEAVKSQLNYSTIIGRPHESEVNLAKKIRQHVACADMVRFTVSGSDATTIAVRLARAFTKKKKILKFEGAYHGIHDAPLVSISKFAGSKEEPLPALDSAGLLSCVPENTIVAPFNDIEKLERIMEDEGHDIAGIILEPLMRGWLVPRKGFLSKIRDLSQKNEVILIFDEVVTGFRLALGGAQEYFNVKPDLAAFGKAFGGGLPIGATVGRKDIMELLDPTLKEEADRVSFLSTFTAHPISMVAGLATIRELEKAGTYEKLANSGERLRKAARDAAEDNDVTLQVCGIGSFWRVLFMDQEPYEIREYYLKENVDKSDRLYSELYLNGIAGNPLMNRISTAHTDEDLERTEHAIYQAMKSVKD